MSYEPKREAKHYIELFTNLLSRGPIRQEDLPLMLSELCAESWNSGYDQAVIDMGKLKR